ncbi:restriction endonuclease subunit S [Enterococcus olivae]
MISACYEKLISETNNIGFIEDLGQIVGGGTPSKKIDEYYGDEIPWLTPKDLSNCNLLYTKCGENSITQLGYDKSSAKLMPTHSILFSSRAPIGYLTIADNEISTNQGFKSIVPHKDIPYTFVYETLKHETVNIEHSAGGSTFKEISGTQLKKHKIPLPNKDELQVFHLTVEPFFIETREYELQNQQLQILRNTLLPKLISGEIFINN